MVYPHPDRSPIPSALFEEQLLPHSERLSLDESQELFYEGDSHPYIYVLISGWVIYFKTLANGQRQVLEIVLPGELIGFTTEENSSVDYTACTLTRCQLYRIKKSKLIRLIVENTQLSRRLINWQHQRNQQCDALLLMVGQASAINKVAYFFVDLLDRLGFDRKSVKENIFVPLERENIADFVGVSIVHLSRVLVEMKQKSIMYHRNGLLTIYDLATLRKLARAID